MNRARRAASLTQRRLAFARRQPLWPFATGLDVRRLGGRAPRPGNRPSRDAASRCSSARWSSWPVRSGSSSSSTGHAMPTSGRSARVRL